MILELDGLGHRYGDRRAVEDVTFAIAEGELVALLGPSGCGKTTIVDAIAGHLRPTAGAIRLHGENVTPEPPESRTVGVVFQESTLFPHLTVGENVGYGLDPNGIDPDDRESIVSRQLELVDLHGRREDYPSELSRGQKRRVELARALAPEPDVLLLDEPLSALDRSLRERLREEIARIQRRTGVSTLFVTHDQRSAMALADRLVVMNDGRISGVGRPRDLYESPPTPFVASFLGWSTPIPATVVDRDPPTISLGGCELTVESVDLPEGEVACYVRPDGVSLGVDSGGDLVFDGVVERVADVGRRYEVTVELSTGDDLVVDHGGSPPAVGDHVSLAVEEDALAVFGRGD